MRSPAFLGQFEKMEYDNYASVWSKTTLNTGSVVGAGADLQT